MCLVGSYRFCLPKNVYSVAARWISYSSSPSSIPLIAKTIGSVISEASYDFSDREALVSCHQNYRLPFSKLKTVTDRVASGFLSLGLRPGDRIGLMGPNSAEWYLTYLSAMKAGLYVVNINPAYRPTELENCINKVGISSLVVPDTFKSSDYVAMLLEIAPELDQESRSVMCTKVPSLKSVVFITEQEGLLKHSRTFRQVTEDVSEKWLDMLQEVSHEIQFEDPCNIQFTSGTTGSPKAAVLSHFNIVNNGFFTGHRFGYALKSHRICTPVPLYHCFGCVVSVMSSLLHGSTVVLSSAGFDPDAALHAVHNERCTALYGTPTMFVDILNSPVLPSVDLMSLETGAMAGSPCPAPLVRQVIDKLHMRDFCIVFGMTETSPATFATYPMDDVETRATTVGCLLPHTEAMVVDAKERGVKLNEVGELWIRGYCNFLGYWGEEEKTQEILTPNGWLKTGDMVQMDKNGYVSICGRAKEMIIRGGENIYPKEIEEFIHNHPEVADVYVFGVPDQRMGEELCAWVKLKEGRKTLKIPGDLRKWCHGRIAHFKIPRYIEFRSDYPLTISGKVQKHKMREVFMAEQGMKEPLSY